MVISSINKGKSFERTIAKYLTEKTGVKFHRTPMSGGFQTTFNTKGTEFSGDVFTEEKFKNITIECKAHKDLTLPELFNPKSKLFQWIQQSIDESKDNDWILFFKINNKGTYILYGDTLSKDTMVLLMMLQMKGNYIGLDDKWTIRKL